MVVTSSAIDAGVYTLTDASRYLGVSASTVRSWFLERADHRGNGPVFVGHYNKVGDDYAISFLNLIEAYVARFFRRAGVSARIVRRSHELLRQELGTAFPFAHEDLRTDGVAIIRHAVDSAGDTCFTDVVTRNRLFKEISGGLQAVDYGAEKLAELWRIAGGVTIDPLRAFGQPTVLGSNVTTHVIAAQFEANDRDTDLVANLYDISPERVRDAVAFEKGLRRSRAA